MHVLMTASSTMVMEPVVMPLVVVMMVGLVEYALVLPPNLVVVVVLARYDLEQPKILDQPVRYLVYAIEWYLQGNSSHLQWGYLSRYPHSLISRVAQLLCMHIWAGLIFPQINPKPDASGPWQLILSAHLCRLD